MYRTILSIAAALFFPFSMAYGEEIYRCPGPNGTSVYQPNPCKGGTYKGSMNSVPASPQTNTPTSQTYATPPLGQPPAVPSDLDRQKAFIASRELQYKKDDIHALISKNDALIRSTQSLMDAEIELLRAKKGLAKNNLAGATWEASLSEEMQAIVSRHKVTIDMKQDENKRLREELSKL